MGKNKTMVMYINKTGNVLEEATNFKKTVHHLCVNAPDKTFQMALFFTFMQLIELCYLIKQKKITDEKGIEKLISLATSLDLLQKETTQ